MKNYWKQVWQKIYHDIKQYYVLFLVLGVYVLVAYLVKFPICPIRAIWGMPCPGCGITRAVMSILKMDYLYAWNLHPFSYLIIFSAVLWFVGRYLTNWKMKWFEYYATGIGVGMLIFYLYRMICFYPNLEPMVYNHSSLLGLLLKLLQQ